MENGELLEFRWSRFTALTTRTCTSLGRWRASRPANRRQRRHDRAAAQGVRKHGKGFAHAGATFDDVVRSTTYVTDIEEYYRCSAVRFEYFRKNRPASVLIQVVRLGHRDAMVEIEVEAIVEPERLKRKRYNRLRRDRPPAIWKSRRDASRRCQRGSPSIFAARAHREKAALP